MAIDIRKFFDEDLPRALANDAENARTIGAKLQLDVEGEGQWNIDVSPTGPSCKAGTGPSEVQITMSADAFQVFYEDPKAKGMSLYLQGKIKIQGNTMLAMKLDSLFKYKPA